MPDPTDKATQQFYNDPDFIAQGLLSSDFVFDFGGEGFEKENGAYTLQNWRDEFYRWSDGCWIRLSDAEMKRLVVEHIQKLNDDNSLAEKNRQIISISTQRVNNVLLCLKGRIGTPETVELNSWPDGREKLIYTASVGNGLLMIDNKDGKPVLAKHTPNFFSVIKLPYPYDEKAECPEWVEFLDEIMRGKTEYLNLLQEWCGYLFRPDLREQRFLLCTGEGANGKGVFFEVVQALVGAENCSQVSLSRFSSPFALYSTLGKVVNLTNESSHIIEDSAETILKSFVAGDTFTFERKFKEPVNAVPTAKIMIATNSLPRFNDKTQAIWRRILFVPFDKIIADEAQIKNLAEQLKQELSGILNWSLSGLQRLNKNGGFSIPESSKELIEEYRRDSDPCRAFLLENYIYSPNGCGIACSELYEQYKRYCETNNCSPMNNRTFGQQVRRIFPDTVRQRKGDRENRGWFYQGLVSRVSYEALI